MSVLPLVAAQPGIWIADQISPPNTYAVAHFIDIRGNVNVQLLKQAIMAGMSEADTLRMKFTADAMQILSDDPLPEPEIIDWRVGAQKEECAEEAANQLMKEDLAEGLGMIKNLIMQIGDDHWIWYQRYHHLQVDGFSFTVLTKRIVDLYSQGARGSENILQSDPSFTPFSEVVKEYEDYNRSERKLKDEKFWRDLTSGLPKQQFVATTNIVRKSTVIEGIKDADEVLALLVMWILRLSNKQDLCFGYIFMRRLGSVALKAAGPVINVLPMPVHLEPNVPIDEASKQLGGLVKKMRRHQKYDLETQVYGPVINFKSFDYHLDFEGAKCETYHLAAGPVRDIELEVFMKEDGSCTVEVLANANLYESKDIEKNIERLHLLKAQLHEGISWDQANILLEAEQSLGRGPTVDIGDRSLVPLVRDQVLRTPDAIALQDANLELTYGQMQLQVDALALELQKLGVEHGDFVAVSLPRSVFLSIALQAILRLGAAWVPLDSEYPADRLQYMLEDSRPKLLISDAKTSYRTFVYDGLLREHTNISITSNERSDTAAYVIYTSGSTGKPKGTVINHKAIVNRLMWMQNEYKLTDTDVVLQKTPYSFDVSVWELFWPLISGARLAFAPPGAHRDPRLLKRLIIDLNVTTIHFVPSMLAIYTQVFEEKGSLRRVFCSGEALPTDLAKRWEKISHTPLYNLYGPTEAAIDVTSYPAYGFDIENCGMTVPIGYPVWNTCLQILDNNGKPLPVGVAGDLYISGVQLAEGYLHQKELTDARFFLHEGKRVYKTGDVAQWLENGAIEFLGRSDDQVKIRGQRIELAEIESVLERLPEVSHAAVQPQILTKSGDKDVDARQLVGYVVLKNAGTFEDIAGMRETIAAFLPEHMVPVTIVVLDKLPLSSAGKLDRRALPLPKVTRSFREPSFGLESSIASAISAVLGCDKVSAEDDFFSLGGHSLLAVKLATKLRQDLSLPVSIGQIMKAPRVSDLAQLLKTDQAQWSLAGYEAELVFRNGSGPTLFCLHPASGFAWQFSVLSRYLDERWSIVGIQSADSQGPLAKAEHLTDLVAHQCSVIQKRQPHGPYFLMGYSLGGTLAHAVAAELKSRGENVVFLGLLDTWPPETQNWDERSKKNVVDKNVIIEMQRERQQFVDAQQGLGDSASRLFDVIEVNYKSAVRLLTTAKSRRFEGTTTLFVAERTLPAGTDLQAIWSSWTQELHTLPVDCSHVDIISPRTLQELGPRINEILLPLID